MCTSLLGPDDDMPRMLILGHCSAARSGNLRSFPLDGFRVSFVGWMCTNLLGPDADMFRMKNLGHCSAARSASSSSFSPDGLPVHDEALTGCDSNDFGWRFRLWATKSIFACSGVTGTAG